jgi:asparagine synthase (glutamine-hydrolysing)
MCGLTGFLQAEGGITAEMTEAVMAMTQTLVHRGPDDFGVWVDSCAGVALGHRRLAIQDLSPAGHQPMQSASGRFVLVFNGEIYNHLELRRLLGEEWRGCSDTETLLEAIARWGVERTLLAVVGMFAFALWDRSERCLVLARDRMGEKPLYYGLHNGIFLFGSELRALRAHRAFEDYLDNDALQLYFERSYIPAPYSIYKGIAKLPAGAWLRIPVAALESLDLPPPINYWSVESVILTADEQKFTGSLPDAVDHLLALMRQVVANQSLSDVPLGAFLSGGVDSSLVVMTMQSLGRVPTKTFSIGVPDERLDESQYAARVASLLGADHHTYIVGPSEALAVIPSLADVWDEPFADSSQIPTLILCRFAREKVSVALSGDGGDELFLGYNHYRYLRTLWRSRCLAYLRVERLLRVMGSCMPGGFLRSRLRRIEATLDVLGARQKSEMIALYRSRYRRDIVNVKSVGRESARRENLDIATLSGLIDAQTYLPDDIMVKVDRASMSVSLETRAPLLDHRVVEFAASLPQRYLLSASLGKIVLREAVERRLPIDLMRRKKQGFSIPLATWLRGELRDWAESLLVGLRDLDGVLDSRSVLTAWRSHQAGVDHSESLWSVLMFLQFLDRQRVNVQ